MRRQPDAALVLAPALFVMGVGAGRDHHAQPGARLMEVDPVTGSTAGGVLQTAQRIGLAIGQAVIGAVFFAEPLGAGTSAASYAQRFAPPSSPRSASSLWPQPSASAILSAATGWLLKVDPPGSPVPRYPAFAAAPRHTPPAAPITACRM